MADIEEVAGKDYNGISVFDYFDIYIGARIEDQLADKVRNPFILVNGKIDPDSEEEVNMYKASVDSFVNAIFENGRNPILPSEIPVSLPNNAGCILFTKINNGDNEITYESRSGLQESQTLPTVHSIESINRLMSVSSVLPTRQPSRTEMTGVYDENALRSAPTPTFLKGFAATNDNYGFRGSIRGSGLYGRSSIRIGGSSDSSIGAKIMSIPLLVVRNTRELKRLNGKDLKPGDLSLSVSVDPNDSMSLMHDRLVQSDYEVKDGVHFNLVRYKVITVKGTCAKIFEEKSGFENNDETLIESISYLFGPGKWCCFINMVPCKIHSYQMSGGELLVDILVHKGYYDDGIPDGVNIFTGSTIIDSSRHSVSEFISKEINKNPAIGPKPHADFIPESIVPENRAKAIIDTEKNRVKNNALSSINYRTDSDSYYINPTRVFSSNSLYFSNMLDAEILFINIIYNPYDISSVINNNQGRTPIDNNGINYKNAPIDTSRISAQSDIFDTFGVSVSLSTSSIEV